MMDSASVVSGRVKMSGRGYEAYYLMGVPVMNGHGRSVFKKFITISAIFSENQNALADDRITLCA